MTDFAQIPTYDARCWITVFTFPRFSTSWMCSQGALKTCTEGNPEVFLLFSPPDDKRGAKVGEGSKCGESDCKSEGWVSIYRVIFELEHLTKVAP